MGDRISIQFKNGKDLSVVLFNHWGGMGFLDKAKEYTNDLVNELAGQVSNGTDPLDRLEPETVILDFLRKILPRSAEQKYRIPDSSKRIRSSLYLGATEEDGDNSDNGHHIIDLTPHHLRLEKERKILMEKRCGKK